MSSTFLEEIAILKKKSFDAYTKDTVEELIQITNQMAKDSLAQTTIGEGDAIPRFELPDASGSMVNSHHLLQSGPLVVSFYRGGWCPFCSLELKFLQKIYTEVHALGGEIVAISPQIHEYSQRTKEDNGLEFSVLSDLENVVSKQFGLVFTLVKHIANIYRINFDLDLKAINGNEDYEFPVPATYIVKPDGTVHYAFVDVDYMQRLEPHVVLEQLAQVSS